MTYVFINGEEEAYSVENVGIDPEISFDGKMVRVVLNQMDNKMTKPKEFQKLSTRIQKEDLILDSVRFVNHQDILQEELCMKEAFARVIQKPYGKIYEIECMLPSVEYSLRQKESTPKIKSLYNRSKQ